MAVIEIFLISEWKGSIANWLARAKQPGLAILEDFLISSKADSIKPYVNFDWIPGSKEVL